MTRIRFGIPLLAGVLVAAWGLSGPLRADDKALPSDLALASRDPAGFVSIRVGDLAASAAGKEFMEQLHKDKDAAGDLLADLHSKLIVPPADIERLTVVLGSQVMIVRTTKPYDRDKLLDALGGHAVVQRYKGKTVYMGGDDQALAPVDDDVFVRGPAGQVEKLLDAPAGAEGKPALDEALELAAGKHHVTAAFNPAALVMELGTRAEERFQEVGPKVLPGGTTPPPPPLNEKKEPPPCGESAADEPSQPDVQALLEKLPPEALPYKPLLQARLVTLTLDADEGLRLEGRVTYADKDLAADGETSLKTALYVLRELMPRTTEEMFPDPESAKDLKPLFKQLQEALRTAAVRAEGTTVTVSVQAKIDPAVFAAAALLVRRRAQDVESANNMKQIALAMMNFNDANGTMPLPALCDQKGKPLLSWRVALLPYIEQENLYNQFHFDEPWDSPNNKKLLEKMPKVYAPVHGKTKQPYSTYYQVFVGQGAPFQMVPGRGLPIASWMGGPRLPASFPDGTSQTFLVVEAGEAVPWTKPNDIPFDEKKPVPPLGGDFGFGFHAALADGSVLFIKKDIDDKLLKLLIMPADGNPIDWDKVPVIGRRAEQSFPPPPTIRGNPPPPEIKPPASQAPPPANVKPPEARPRPPEKP